MTICPGTRIKELRMLTGMSQEELGKRIGVKRAAVNKYELGTVRNIPLSTIEKIANIFEVSPTYIVGWDDKVSNPLSAEVKVIQGVQQFFGKDAVELLEIYHTLSTQGKRRMKQYANDMSSLYHDDSQQQI